jgi:hypothetical protein
MAACGVVWLGVVSTRPAVRIMRPCIIVINLRGTLGAHEVARR